MVRTIPPNGGNLRRSIDAYKRTLGQSQPEDTAAGKTGLPAPQSAPPASGTAASASEAGQVDGLLKTRVLGKGTDRRDDTGGTPGGKKPDAGDGESKYRRAAKFLILIGGNEASRILSALDEEQVEAIAKEISTIRGITAEEAEAVFEEFRNLLRSSSGYAGRASGGIEEARRLLYAAFGPVQGEMFLRRTVPEAAENLLDFLNEFSGDQVAFLLREEIPAVAALVLSRLSPKLSAAVLAALPPGRRLETIRRIARAGQVAPEVLERVAGVLREKARHIIEAGAGSHPATVDGMDTLTAILKHADNSFGERLLEELEEEDPDIGRNLKDRLHTLDDVIEADNRPIQEKLKTMTDRDVALLLKGRRPEFTNKILSNVSSNRRTVIREEGEILGPVPKFEVEAVARDFLAWFRAGREKGKILLHTDEDVIT
ncbi:MAG: flagellar motor switch protein FliG [Treponema sp.]|jgi:flagellar motor switch protein FliG|nr:flagellar motor switch protein FliG [Treponema sp.]